MRAILSVIGKDKQGIIAKVSQSLYELGANIEDISQTIMQEYFTMIMLVDLRAAKKPLADIAEEMKAIGEENGVSIKVQHEDIFNCMHKL